MYFSLIQQGISRWVNDSHSDWVFSKLKEKKNKLDFGLIISLINFRKSENKEKSKKILLSLIKSDYSDQKVYIPVLISLRKLKVFESIPYIERLIESSESEVRYEAKKSLKALS